MEKRIFNFGYIKMPNGTIREAITVTVRSPYNYTTKKKLLEEMNKMLSILEIGAWRRKPVINVDPEIPVIHAYCRYFPGRPEDYKEAKSA